MASKPAAAAPATAAPQGGAQASVVPQSAASAAATSQALRKGALAAAARRKRYFYERSNQRLGIESFTSKLDGLSGRALPTTAPGERRAAKQKTRAALSVRKAGGVETGRPPRTYPVADRLDKPRSGFDNALHRVAHVVPAWLLVALAVLSTLVLLLGAHTILAAARTRRLERHREKLMDDIGLLQEALLPAVPARIGGISTSVAYRPAEGLAAGGDFYDAFALPGGRAGLLLGDVSGHGREALAKTALVRFTVRAHLEAGLSPREALSIAGGSLDGRLGDDFATVIAAIHDPAEGTLTYSSAGHPSSARPHTSR